MPVRSAAVNFMVSRIVPIAPFLLLLYHSEPIRDVKKIKNVLPEVGAIAFITK
mgnify:CR=1 FL=1